VSTGSEGLLTGEVRRRPFREAYTSRFLSVHPGNRTIPLIAFVVIEIYHTPLTAVCQLLSGEIFPIS
jgi:hypothetical protein